jgi:hypothetical protein
MAAAVIFDFSTWRFFILKRTDKVSQKTASFSSCFMPVRFLRTSFQCRAIQAYRLYANYCRQTGHDRTWHDMTASCFVIVDAYRLSPNCRAINLVGLTVKFYLVSYRRQNWQIRYFSWLHCESRVKIFFSFQVNVALILKMYTYTTI